MLRPCADYCLPKERYLQDPDALVLKLKTLNRDLPRFGLLLGWEIPVSNAADKSVSSVYDLSGVYGKGAGPNVANIAFNIGAAAVGRNLATTQPFHSFSQGMSSVLADHLDHETPDIKSEEAWAASLKSSQRKQIHVNQKARLNTFFNVTETSPGLSSSLGMVYHMPVAEILPFLKPEFKSGKQAVLGGEFLPFKQGKYDTDKIWKACKWRFVRLGHLVILPMQKTK